MLGQKLRLAVIKIEVIESGLQFNRNEPPNTRPIGRDAHGQADRKAIHLAGCLIVRHRTQCSLIEEGKPAVGAVSYQLDTSGPRPQIIDAVFVGLRRKKTGLARFGSSMEEDEASFTRPD